MQFWMFQGQVQSIRSTLHIDDLHQNYIRTRIRMVLIKMVSFLHFFFEFSSKFSILEQFSRVAEAYEVLRNLETRAVFDQFGEEGLKNGLPKKMGGWSEGYTFHGDAKRVFRDFFGTDNPFADFQVKIGRKVVISGYFEGDFGRN